MIRSTSLSNIITLENPTIRLRLDPDRSRMMLDGPEIGFQLISPSPLLEVQDTDQRKAVTLSAFHRIVESDTRSASLDNLKSVLLRGGTAGCEFSTEWAISTLQPYLLWRFSVRNLQSVPILLNRAYMLASANTALLNQQSSDYLMEVFPAPFLASDQFGFVFEADPAGLAIYLPGWQSWSYGGWVKVEEQLPRSWLKPFTHPMIYDKSRPIPREKGRFRSEMFAALVDTDSDIGFTCGYLGQRQSFGYVEFIVQGETRGVSIWTDLDQMRLDPDKSFTSDWACLMMSEGGIAVVEEFAALAGVKNQARIPAEATVGWCSWYDYGQSITETDIVANVEDAAALQDRTPMKVIQIDDGFQAEVGDWLTVGPNFSSGMRQVADVIMAADFKAGLWLAPFIGLRRSSTLRNHPDWVLCDGTGKPVSTGFVWNQFGRAFDPSHPGFLSYLEQVISTATAQWGFEYLKLDFLYAGALPGVRYDLQKTRAQAFYHALHMMRKTAGDSVVLVGCGCPLGSGIGIFDSMRIGPDVAPHWKPLLRPFSPLLSREPTLPAAVNAIRNTINKASLHRRWWINDPDCLIVRERDSDLNLREIQSLTTAIGMSGGNVILSDRIGSLSPERLKLFGLLIPPLPGQVRLVSADDSYEHPITLLELNGPIGKWWLMACYNTADDPHQTSLQLDEILSLNGWIHVFDVWRKRYHQRDASQPLAVETAGHHVALLAIRKMSQSPTWIGDTLHLSQGSIVEQWDPQIGQLQAHIQTLRMFDGQAWIFVPGDVHAVSLNKSPIAYEADRTGVVIIQLHEIMEGELEIYWSG
jgi:alpha-galactosidase